MNCYIHVPFCRSKCGYCAFYSESGLSEPAFDAYLAKLADDLERCCGTSYDTLYVGGGTPTLWSAKYLEKFLDIVRSRVCLKPGAEISIESNPETLDDGKIALLRSFFTRISVGVQSFDVQLRENIGRKCSQEKLLRALDLVRQAEFEHWNCDLIYALPGQSAAAWEMDLRKCAEYGVDHLSCYSLTAEEEAAMGYVLKEDDDTAERFYHIAQQVLAEYGIERYEISNYARPGAHCRHNCRVWRGGKLDGFGPSAAGFDGRVRCIEVASLERWLAGEAPEYDEIAREERLNEIFAVNLRTVQGWSRQMWQALNGADSWENRLSKAADLAKQFPGMIVAGDDEIKLSAQGLLFWNSIASELL